MDLTAELRAARAANKYVCPAPKVGGGAKKQKKFSGEAVAHPSFATLPPVFAAAARLPAGTVSVSGTVNLRFPSTFVPEPAFVAPRPLVLPLKAVPASHRRKRRQAAIDKLLTRKRSRPAVQKVEQQPVLVPDAPPVPDPAHAALQTLHATLDAEILAPLICEPIMSAGTPVAARKASRYPVFDETRRRSQTDPAQLDRYVRLPRAYGLVAFADAPGVRGWHERALAKVQPAPRLQPFQGALRTYQVPAMAHVLDKLRTLPCHSGMLDGDCGSGKTCMGLYMAAAFGLPTIIFVHTKELMKQWVERVPQFLPNATVGILQGKNRPAPDVDVCVATIHTVMRLSRAEAKHYQRYGLLLVDEAHHICARTFSETMRLISPPYVVGLTATPERNDGLDAPVQWLVGPILYHLRDLDDEIDIQFVRYKDARFKHAIRKWDKQMDYVGTITKLTTDPGRAAAVAQIAREAVGEGRHVIVLAERVQMLMDLEEALGPDMAGRLKAGDSKATNKNNEEAKLKAVVLGSFKMAFEGLDISTLDTLIIASPCKVNKTFKQPIGRVGRGGSAFKTRIYDFYDAYGMFISRMHGRRRYYEEHGYDILPERKFARLFPKQEAVRVSADGVRLASEEWDGDDGDGSVVKYVATGPCYEETTRHNSIAAAADDCEEDAFWRGRAAQADRDAADAAADDDLDDFDGFDVVLVSS